MMEDKRPDKNEPPQPRVPPELETVVRAGVKAGSIVPGAVALGGTVCSLYAGHRLSFDMDFVVKDFREQFDQVRETLEAEQGWALARVKPPVLILGSLDQVPIGYRQLRRAEPLETIELETADGVLLIPTLREMFRIKAVLACDRHVTRDFYDFAELARLVSRAEVVDALAELDAKWSSPQRPGVALEVMKTLGDCEAVDDPASVFSRMRLLQPKVPTWAETQRICREIAADLSARLIKG